MNTDQSDHIIQKTATVAFTYYPEIHIDAPDFSLRTEIDYCLEELEEADITPQDLDILAALIGRAIIDPTKNREQLVDFLSHLPAAA